MMKKWFSILMTVLLLFSGAAGAEKNVQTEFRITVAEGDYSAAAGLDEDVLNILLLGTDSDGALNYGRTDAMLICSIHKKTGLVQLSSIARDLYVPLPNSSITDRINTANSYGGPRLAMKTVNETLGLNIEHYVTVNFTGFEKAVEILGGVTVELSAAEAGEINKKSGSSRRAAAGPCELDGKQALAYVRIRNLDNNFGRNNRQRTFLKAVVDQVLAEKKIGQIIDLIGVCLDHMDYNLGFLDVVSIAWTVLTKGVTMEMYSCPAGGEYHYATVEGKGSVVMGKTDVMKQSLHQFIYGQ